MINVNVYKDDSIKILKNFIQDLSFENPQNINENNSINNNNNNININMNVTFKPYKNNFFSLILKYTLDCSSKKNNKKLFNLRKYVNDKLTKLNVIVDNINKDTFREKSKFFSYRRSQKLGQNDYGRCISVIALTKFRQN